MKKYQEGSFKYDLFMYSANLTYISFSGQAGTKKDFYHESTKI